MNVSEKRKRAIFRSINEPILDLRADIKRNKIKGKENIDNALFQLELDIIERLYDVLNIKD